MNDNLNVNIFLLDDDYDDISYVRDLLGEIKGINFNVDWSYSYTQGFKKLKINNYDIALIDYRIGAKSGMELINYLLSKGSTTSYFLLAGYNNKKQQKAAFDLGALGCFEKGKLNIDILEQAIWKSIKIKAA